MKKFAKSLLSFALVLILSIGSPILSFAEESSRGEPQWVEEKGQINFDNLTVSVSNRRTVDVQVDNTGNLFERIDGKKEKKKYDKLKKTHPEIASSIDNDITGGDFLCSVGYTYAPLREVDGQLQRIEESQGSSLLMASAASSNTRTSIGTSSPCYGLTLVTKINRTGSSSPYKYTATTTGKWQNSAVSGKKYPASGEDWIFQSCPNIEKEHSFSSKYNHKTSGSTNGIRGKNYFQRYKQNGCVGYGVYDDPIGPAQLSSFTIKQVFYAKANSKTKNINATYIHTWTTMNFSCSLSGKAGISGGEPTAEIGITITPSLKEKWWQLSSDVSYTF